MEAGKLRHRVTIQRPTRTESATGAKTVTSWTNVATVWAEVRPLTAYQLEQAAQQTFKTTHRVSMRWRDDVTTGCRLLFRGRTLDLTGPAINVGECFEELQINAVETGTA